MRKQVTAALLGGTLCLGGVLLPTRACELLIVWKADLTHPQVASPALPPATGTATIQFDFAHPGATVQVDTKNVPDARTVELHISRSYTDHTGPTVCTVYTAAEGSLPATLTRRITETDLVKQTDPKIASFADLVQAVLNGRTYVTVSTKAHPEGALSGFITMRKEAVYTDTPGNISHDPTLHHAAQKSLPYSVTSTVNGTVSH